MATTITTPIKIRYFASARDTGGELETFDCWSQAKDTLEALDAERAPSKEAQMLFAPSANERARGIASEAHCAIVLDYDHASSEGLAELKGLLRELDFDALILPTYSDGAEGKRRFRLVLGVNTPIPPSQVADVRLGVARLLGIEGLGKAEAKDTKRVFYLGAGRESWRHDGELLNWPEFVDEPASADQMNIDDAAVFRDHCPAKRCPAGIEPAAHFAELCRTAPIAVEGEYGPAQLMRVASYGVVGLELDPEVAAEIAWDHFNPRCSPPWRDDQRGDFQRKFTQANQGEPGYLLAPRSADVESNNPWNLVGLDDLWGELPEIDWLVKDLDIAPGAPTMLAGYGYSGKTMAAQALAVSVATGTAYWGAGPLTRPEPGKVVHVDFEQGRLLTAKRYQRLARGMRAPLDVLRSNLQVAALPTMKLDEARAEAALLELCKGARLCVVDSLRAAAPTLDENSSEIRSVLDLMTRVSEATGCAFLVIHHAKKSNGERRGLESARGSSAIFDGCSSVLIFDKEGEGAEAGPIEVAHVKARNTGRCADRFQLRIEDTADGGLRLVSAVVERATCEADAKVPAVLQTVVEKGSQTRTAIVSRTRGADKVLREAVDIAISDGLLYLHGDKRLDLSAKGRTFLENYSDVARKTGGGGPPVNTGVFDARRKAA